MARVQRNISKIISGESSDGCRRWRLPDVGPGPARGDSLPTAGRIEEIQRQAYQEGFELGRREGLESGRAEIREQAGRVAEIAEALSRPLAQLDDELVEELAGLALTIARHIIRREIRNDPGQVVAVVQQAAGELPAAARDIRLFLNPEDAALVREALSLPQEGERAWRIVEDPALTRGGCRIESETSRIDASVEQRLAAIAARLLGGQREEDHDETR